MKHVLSHRVIHADFYQAVVDEGDFHPDEDFVRVKTADLHNFPVSRLTNEFFSLHLEDFLTNE
jgi:hypothetical protein